MANQRINEAGRLIDELRQIDEWLQDVTALRCLKGYQLKAGNLSFGRDLSQMMLAMATNYLAERRSNIVERLETEFKLRDTA